MARPKPENDLPKTKITASSLQKAIQIFRYSGNHRWKFYLGLIFLLLTSATALAFPKFMGWLVDCVKNKDTANANTIALGLMGVLVLQSVFSFFRISLFVNFTENTLANLRLALYSNLVKLPMTFFSKTRWWAEQPYQYRYYPNPGYFNHDNCRIFTPVYLNYR